ncbi:MAG: hypothetical protein JW759_06975 [Candidatus Coatesbacteria bacterium]|nr:hypothetical protein [Candidatus Coatesbacteria bacterium]
MIKRASGIHLCLLVLIGLSCLRPDVCIAGHVELKHDEGSRQVEAYWEAQPSTAATSGLAVQFERSGFPCFVREVSVFVGSTAQFRVRILDPDGAELCEPATVAALEPASWASHVLPSEVVIGSRSFYVLAEIVNAPEPRIGTTVEPGGGSSIYTRMWSSGIGLFPMTYGGNAMIRAVVDVPVQVKGISNTHAPNDHVFVTFDSPMDAFTLTAETIMMQDDVSRTIPGRYEYDDSLSRVEFVPDSTFEGALSVEVSTAVADLYGNHPEMAATCSSLVEDGVDESAPAMPQNLSLEADDEAIAVTWEAVPLADAAGYYLYSGPWAPGTAEGRWLSEAQKTDVGNVVEASVLLAQKELPYRVGVSAYDTARNAGEISFGEVVVHRGSVLLVVESPSPQALVDQGQDQLEESLESGAFDYNVWLEWERGGLPDHGYLNEFDVVFWSMGRRFTTENAGVIELLEQFMSSGGSLFYESRDLLSGRLTGNLFFPTWLHLTYPEKNSDSDAPIVVGCESDPVGDGLQLTYDTKPGKSKRYFEPQDGAVGFLTVKDKAGEICGLRYADAGDYGYRVVFSTALLALVYNTGDRDKLMTRGLCWLEGKQLDFRIAANSRVLQPFSLLQLFVSANTLAGVQADVDAYLAVLLEADGGSALLFYDGTGFVSEMRPFVSGVHLDSGMFLPRTKIFEYLYRGGLPSGEYTFFAALMQAGTQTFVTDARSTVVFIE